MIEQRLGIAHGQQHMLFGRNVAEVGVIHGSAKGNVRVAFDEPGHQRSAAGFDDGRAVDSEPFRRRGDCFDPGAFNKHIAGKGGAPLPSQILAPRKRTGFISEILLKIFGTPKRETHVGILMEIYKLPRVFRKMEFEGRERLDANATNLDSESNQARWRLAIACLQIAKNEALERPLLSGIAHSPDGIRSIVGHHQRTVGSHRNANRAAPRVAVGKDEAGQEIFIFAGGVAGLMQRNPDHFVAGARRPCSRSHVRRRKCRRDIRLGNCLPS